MRSGTEKLLPQHASKSLKQEGRNKTKGALPSFWNLPKSELSALSAFARSCMARTLPIDSRLPFAGMVGARQAEIKVSIVLVGK